MNSGYMYLLTDSMFRPIALFQRQDEADMASQLIHNSRVKEMRVRGSYLDVRPEFKKDELVSTSYAR